MRLDFCVACGAKEDIQHHHLVPRLAGGSDDDANMVSLCVVCHGKIHDMEWAYGHSEACKLGWERNKGKILAKNRERRHRETIELLELIETSKQPRL